MTTHPTTRPPKWTKRRFTPERPAHRPAAAEPAAGGRPTRYLIDSTDPADAVDWFMGMNAQHLGSDRVSCDVLLMCGQHDAFQPPSLARSQAWALSGARFVTERTFARSEQADRHCQIGNVELACQVLVEWLQGPNPPNG